MSDTPNNLKIMALIYQIEAYSKEILDKNDPKDILELQENLVRLNPLKEKVEAAKDSILKGEAEKLNYGEQFSIGLVRFKKEKSFSNGKLDESKLELFVKDKDNLELFYKKVPKTKQDIEGLLRDLGLNVNPNQLYIREEKEGFKVKQLN